MISLSCPQNCSIVCISSMRYFYDELGTVIGEGPLWRCVPEMESQVIRLYKMGNTSKSVLQPSCVAPGVNTRAVHEFNVQSGYCLPDEQTEEERARESERASISRSLRVVRELAACNPWSYFVTITLSPEKWDRENPEALQAAIREESKRWKRKNKKGESKCSGYKYLFVPERHKDGSIHLHGLVMGLPLTMIEPYTMEEVRGSAPLPAYICNKVREGESIYHCPEWDSLFGYNLIEPIRDLDKVSSYLIKYISKDLGACTFASRYWCSRGLQRASLVAKFYIAETSLYGQETKIKQYRTYMQERAIVGSKGMMYSESYRPAIFRGRTCESQKLMSVVAYIDNRIYPLFKIVQYLESQYAKTPNHHIPNFSAELQIINVENIKKWRAKQYA